MGQRYRKRTKAVLPARIEAHRPTYLLLPVINKKENKRNLHLIKRVNKAKRGKTLLEIGE
jgi:hypothetical protein